MDESQAQEKRKRNLMTVLLVLMFVVFVAFRQLYQQGRKLLANAHPWDYIALLVIVGLLAYYLYRTHYKTRQGKG